MTAAAIEATGLTKVYELGDTRELAGGWLRRIAGRRANGTPTITALNNVSFSVTPGEAVGIIGANGAGKSTLLKVLTRVTAPTSGHGVVRGRVGTILEVGTGFHPELTGRENVYLSGAILGLRHHEVRQRMDAIIDFAGVEKFVDTPVKRYSSGMYVRLAFAVAAHLDPDILVVDEVLAVGDIGFQKRCLARMEDETRRQGRTILFVSHNLEAIRALCGRALLLDKGALTCDGPTSNVIQAYLSNQRTRIDLRESSLGNRRNRTTGRVRFTTMAITGAAGTEKWCFQSGEPAEISLQYEVFDEIDSLGLMISFVAPGNGAIVSTIKETLKPASLARGARGECRVTIDTSTLRPGSLAMTICLGDVDFSVIDDIIDSNVSLPFIEIESGESDLHRRSGYVDLPYRIEVQ
ncbi:MAG TPA: ABC transporter ATP-binding protein [Pseudolabrys sp.]|nr:ABC transporter ATP-binding protein [Pseudolabrys sp.]